MSGYQPVHDVQQPADSNPASTAPSTMIHYRRPRPSSRSVVDVSSSVSVRPDGQHARADLQGEVAHAQPGTRRQLPRS